MKKILFIFFLFSTLIFSEINYNEFIGEWSDIWTYIKIEKKNKDYYYSFAFINSDSDEETILDAKSLKMTNPRKLQINEEGFYIEKTAFNFGKDIKEEQLENLSLSIETIDDEKVLVITPNSDEISVDLFYKLNKEDTDVLKKIKKIKEK